MSKCLMKNLFLILILSLIVSCSGQYNNENPENIQQTYTTDKGNLGQ